MSTPLWVHELTEEFWSQVGNHEEFPRDLRMPIALALPISLVLLPRLRVSGIDGWLSQHGIACQIDASDRFLCACLVARYGFGFIFLDGSDPPDEQRFSLAHELAHFLRDYWHPRTIASERLGTTVLEVFDGERPPTPAERTTALLAKVKVGFYVDLMERDGEGMASAHVAAVERDADRLAFELLAPAEDVLQHICASSPEKDAESMVSLLVSRFGLPVRTARRYAAMLRSTTSGGKSLFASWAY